MLRPESESYHPGGNPAKKRKPCDQTDREGWRELARSTENAPDDSILNRELHSLRPTDRPLTPC